MNNFNYQLANNNIQSFIIKGALDRNYLIDSGQILAQGTKRELLKNSEAIKRYFGTNFEKF